MKNYFDRIQGVVVVGQLIIWSVSHVEWSRYCKRHSGSSSQELLKVKRFLAKCFDHERNRSFKVELLPGVFSPKTVAKYILPPPPSIIMTTASLKSII